ncbi:CD99 antigen isoform X1 [Bubalus bubalis]|uniref:CD99 antigen isoform X1 n=1 Tax=Bubalus bubalis TaxID=89462 RepID=UPI001E1B7020|nr:CD99 antigen isoform X1 [Bubalus bubalis]
MARRAALTLILFALLGSLVSTQDDFDLSHALDDDKKPTLPPKPAPGNDGFDLNDAIGGGGNEDRVSPNPPKPKPQPNPKQPGTSENDNWDLNDAVDGGGNDGGATPDSPNSKPQPDPKQPDSNEESPGVIPGIVGAIVVALGGAISSFIAYQKKKLCFKENAEEGQVNMENHRSTAEPAVQQTLLEK